MKISVEKTKAAAFKGKNMVSSKIVIDRNIFEQVNTFRHLENEISYQGEVNVNSSKIAKFLSVPGLSNTTLRSDKVQKETRLKVYKIHLVEKLT